MLLAGNSSRNIISSALVGQDIAGSPAAAAVAGTSPLYQGPTTPATAADFNNITIQFNPYLVNGFKT